MIILDKLKVVLLLRKRNRRRYNLRNQKLIISMFFVSLLFISVGYSILTTNISITGTSYIPSDNVRKIIADGLSNGDLIEDTTTNASLDFASKYYFTGNNPSNYVVFNNACWRIVNIANNNDVKIVYEGKITSNSDCVGVATSDSGMLNTTYTFDTENSNNFFSNNFYQSDMKTTLDGFSNGTIDNIILSSSNLG